MSGDGRIDVSPDGQKLLLGIDMDEEAHRKDWDGPLPAVWTLDLASKKRPASPRRSVWLGRGAGSILDRVFPQPGRRRKNRVAPQDAPAGGAMSKAITKGVTQPSVSH